MSKWKAPENFGPGCSVGGRWFDVVDGVLTIEDDGGDYGAPLGSLGFTPMPHDEQAAPAAKGASKAAKPAAVDAEEAVAADTEAATDVASDVQSDNSDAGEGEALGDDGGDAPAQTSKPARSKVKKG